MYWVGKFRTSVDIFNLIICMKSWQSTTWHVYHDVHVIIWVWRSTAYNRRNKMDPNKVKDFAGRLQKGSKGAGLGLGLLAAAGGAAYALYQSMYTGARNENPPFRILFFPISPITLSGHAASAWPSRSPRQKTFHKYYFVNKIQKMFVFVFQIKFCIHTV